MQRAAINPFRLIKSAGNQKESRHPVLGLFNPAPRPRAGSTISILAFSVALCWLGPGLTTKTLGQGDTRASIRQHDRLSLQPEADKMRRRLGKRFNAAGLEKSILTGFVTIGNERPQIRIIRTQEDDGEHVSVALGGGQPTLLWTRNDGALSNGARAGGDERGLLERIVLDSPDQFIQAQLSGASYFTVARNVRPQEAGDSPAYTGPTWDLVRIGVPQGLQNKPLSPWRLYYINHSTGLIDKVISQEQGVTIVAELSGWANDGGELEPTLIRWSRGGQVLMELSLNNIGHGPKQ